MVLRGLQERLILSFGLIHAIQPALLSVFMPVLLFPERLKMLLYRLNLLITTLIWVKYICPGELLILSRIRMCLRGIQ